MAFPAPSREKLNEMMKIARSMVEANAPSADIQRLLEAIQAEKERVEAKQNAISVSLAAEAIRRGGQKRKPSLEDRLCYRMDWMDLQSAPYHVHLYAQGGPVFIFVVKNNQHVVIVDDSNMFPSDQTVTQLRLLGEERGD